MLQKRRPGDRRRVWNETCIIKFNIGIFIGTFILIAGLTATKGREILIGWASIMYFLSLLELVDLKRGWKIKHERPPWADKHDEINRKHGIIINEPTEEYKKTHKYICDYERERKLQKSRQ